jgi:hypothetical protein
MTKLEKIISETFAVMVSQGQQSESDNNICGLKRSAVKHLVSQKKITDKMELSRFNQIQTGEQLEMFLQQYAITDNDLLSIYRDFFYNGQL